jgi:O-antigen biosynthesis protein
MAAARVPVSRVVVDGKFFRLDDQRFCPRGVTYGPFSPNESGEPFPAPDRAARDFVQIRALGANTLRVYEAPPRWFLDAAVRHELRLLIDIPWPKYLCFLDAAELRARARDAVRKVVTTCRQHPAVFAYSVVNEIPAGIVRWSGAPAINTFLEELVDLAKGVDPTCLCTFGSFPPTEYLRPRNLDFVCFNVFLHQRPAFERYLARLQMVADTQPLVIGECGIDTLREGEPAQAEILGWQVESAFRGGVAGLFVFSFTDDWHHGGRSIEDWAFGLTTRDRRPKPAFEAVRRQFGTAPRFPLARRPRVSVVVACYNGEKTLPACLDSLSNLNYPDYEVILVDDGSTDATPHLANGVPNVRCVRQNHLGLSVARNTGIALASGEVVAFTDADCRADPDWLQHLVEGLLAGGFVGMGGHNLLPPEDSRVAAAVLVSPGGPAHVMLTDSEAEHIPGCNMAFFKWALAEIGGFDPIFRTAGDDVDVCWRLQRQGYRIGFSPAGFVWHYRRSTIPAYLRQQRGYGEAEALLARKHPERFNPLGGGIWRGRIYSAAQPGFHLGRSMIYSGLFGSGLFQRLYSPAPPSVLLLATSLEFHGLVNLPLVALAFAFPGLWALATTTLLLSVAVCVVAGAQASPPRGKQAWWSRPLVGILFFLQPLVRGWARYRWRLTARSVRPTTFRRRLPLEAATAGKGSETLSCRLAGAVDRYAFLQAVLTQLSREGWEWRSDLGWEDYDLEIYGRRWSRVRLVTVAEPLDDGRQTLRCRVRAAWSMAGGTALATLLGATLIVCGLLDATHPWIWLLCTAVPVLGFLIERERRLVRRILVALLDEVAREQGLVNLKLESATAPPLPSPAPPLAATNAGLPPAR